MAASAYAYIVQKLGADCCLPFLSRCTWQYLLPETGGLLHGVPSLLVAAHVSIRPNGLFDSASHFWSGEWNPRNQKKPKEHATVEAVVAAHHEDYHDGRLSQ